MKRLVVAAAVAAIGFLAVPAGAQAHPLGNFTVSQYAGITVAPTVISIDYVLDMAELTTAGERAGIENAGAAKKCTSIAAANTLTVAGKPLALHGSGASLTFPPGQAGLPTLRLECQFTAPAEISRPEPIGFAFGAYTDRLGLREIVVTAENTTISGPGISSASRTARLRSYPDELLSAPTDHQAVSFTAAPGGTADATATNVGSEPQNAGTAARLQAALASLAGRTELTTGIALLGVFLAMLLGAGHAIAPGHGKTIMAAYLIGQKGRRRQALEIAATVTATHTAGVLALGVIISASFTLAPQTMYRWLAIANGLIVAAIGIILLRRALHGQGHHGHGHGHGHHHHHGHSHHHHGEAGNHGHHHHHDDAHDHGHQRGWPRQLVPAGQVPAGDGTGLLLPSPRHDHGGAHSHDTAHSHDADHQHGHDHDHDHWHGHDGQHHRHDAAPATPGRKTVLAMGFAGGLTPSPSAVVVLLGAAAVGRAWFGVLLVVAYGAGMAATLTGVGMALAKFSDRLQLLLSRRWGTVLGKLPLVSGAFVLAAGLLITILAASGSALFV
ncbi:urease accessory protein UreH domain-containing protein [Catelliglobosispora koreensis]|uniref:urease accessory protein UreH domain-containing protein n=1 Tax=Catelliglobosispora koreensis TaxID=129052 RepID=UPI0003753CBE|nr:sulfite exporter TauE/SafE family protein [Catelliglobosispora koreensis]